ncbi:winged helix DNA-binding domain-containing protein [Micromonospora sp. NPDC003197]
MGARRPVRPGVNVLSLRALNRAVLARQLLLRRADLPVVAAVERVLGLNAQGPNGPYVALWTRLERFAIRDLTAAIEDRSLVRSTMMRATQHLMSVPDFRLVRPVLAPLLRRVQRNAFGRRTVGVDLAGLVTEARELLADGRVLTRPELGRLLVAQRPGADAAALGWSVQYLEPLIHPAPSGTWRTYGATPFVRADWTGVRPETTAEERRQMVRRYLAAFGPATVADARAWSGVSGLREVFEQLRPELRVYADESGRELFDLPDAPMPAADLPVPVRFLPEFDAPVLAYADRNRMMTDQVRSQVCVGAGVSPSVLVDGTVAATWSVSGSVDTATLTVELLRPLSMADRVEVEAEADRLLTFTNPEATQRDIRITQPQ